MFHILLLGSHQLWHLKSLLNIPIIHFISFVQLEIKRGLVFPGQTKVEVFLDIPVKQKDTVIFTASMSCVFTDSHCHF